MSKLGLYCLVEFKVSNSFGHLLFRKAQILFYRNNPKLRIHVLAWDTKKNRLILASAHEIVEKGSLHIKCPVGDLPVADKKDPWLSF
jgi:hypothetical protein